MISANLWLSTKFPSENTGSGAVTQGAQLAPRAAVEGSVKILTLLATVLE